MMARYEQKLLHAFKTAERLDRIGCAFVSTRSDEGRVEGERAHHKYIGPQEVRRGRCEQGRAAKRQVEAIAVNR